MTGLVLGWRRSQQRRSPGTAPSVWGGARNQPSGAEVGAGAEAQGGGRRKWCELLCHRLKLQQGKKKSLCEILCQRTEEKWKKKMEKEKWCELSTQRTRLNKGKKQIYVNFCVRERGSARGRETNIMWTLVLGNRAHEGKVGNDGSFCVGEEGPWFLCQTICLESDNETRSWLYWTLEAPYLTVTLSVNAIICLFSVLWKILTPFLFKCLIYFSTDNCSSRSINMKWHDVNIKYEY